MKPLERKCILLLTLAAVARCLRFAPEEGTALTETKDVNMKRETHREKRSGNINLNPRQNCNTWSPWVNTHTPSANDPNDTEQVSRQDTEVFCPPQHGGHVSNVSCRDNRGEPFFGNITSPDNDYFISCYSPVVGVECVLLIHVQANKSCPDMAMQYFCSCSNETTYTFSTDMSTTTKYQYSTLNNETTPTNVEEQNTYRTDGFDAGRVFVPWWVLNLLIALIVFVICMCTTVGMYKHLQKKLRDDKHGTRVYPTA